MAESMTLLERIIRMRFPRAERVEVQSFQSSNKVRVMIDVDSRDIAMAKRSPAPFAEAVFSKLQAPRRRRLHWGKKR